MQGRRTDIGNCHRDILQSLCEYKEINRRAETDKWKSGEPVSNCHWPRNTVTYEYINMMMILQHTLMILTG